MLAFCEKNLAPPPPPTWQEQNVLETNSSNNTMNLSDQSSNGITRRNFMKKTALTVGAVTILGQGIGFSQNGSSPTIKKIYTTKEKRRFFVPGSTQPESWPTSPGLTGTNISTTEISSAVYTSAVKDTETVTDSSSVYRPNWNGQGEGYEYEMTIEIKYKNIVQ